MKKVVLVLLLIFSISKSFSEPANYPIKSIKSSSQLSNGHTKFDTTNLISLTAASWIEGKPDSGIGEFIEIIFEEKMKLRNFLIINGHGNPTQYRKKNRVKELELIFDDKKKETVTLADTSKIQKIILKKEVITKSIKLVIRSVYQGEVDNDTCIDELIFYDFDTKHEDYISKIENYWKTETITSDEVADAYKAAYHLWNSEKTFITVEYQGKKTNLNLAYLFADLVIKSKSSDSLKKYLDYYTISTSADEEIAFSFERIFKEKPILIFHEIRNYDNEWETKFLEAISWGFINNRLYGPINPYEKQRFHENNTIQTYAQRVLTKENYKDIFFKTYPALIQNKDVYGEYINIMFSFISKNL
jgi:hypothetical protein